MKIYTYRAAKLLVDRHGDEAPIHAAMRAGELMDQGDMDGRAVWLRIKAAVEELLRIEVGGVVHRPRLGVSRASWPRGSRFQKISHPAGSGSQS